MLPQTISYILSSLLYADYLIGASVSEPHTSESNWDFSYIIYYIFSGVRRSVYSQRCNLTREPRAACGL